jgi:superfamily I DNA/RNA helicase
MNRPSELAPPLREVLRIRVIRDDALRRELPRDEVKGRLTDPELERVVKAEHLRRLDDLASRLERSFDPRSSRALVFARTRRDTHRYAAVLAGLLAGRGLDERLRVEAFHAGLSSEERLDLYRRFQRGEIAVLVATKAFGMGMDIPNIHLLAHLDLPSALEDYLQEIGRAGRDRRLLEQAGYSAEQPLECLLYFSVDEVRRARGFLQRGRLLYHELEDFRREIFRLGDLVQGRRKGGRVVLPLSASMLALAIERAADKLPMALHWLERLGRVRVGDYTLPALRFEKVAPKGIGDSPAEHLRRLLAERLAASRAARGDRPQVQVSSLELMRAAKVQEMAALFQVLRQGEAAGLFRVADDVWIALRQPGPGYEDGWCAREGRLPFRVRQRFSLARRLVRRIAGAGADGVSESRVSLVEWITDDTRREVSGESAPWINATGAATRARLEDEWRGRQLRRVRTRLGPLLRLLRAGGRLRLELRFDRSDGLVYQFRMRGAEPAADLDMLQSLCRRLLPVLLEMTDQGAEMGRRRLVELLETLDCRLDQLEDALGLLAACELTQQEGLLGRAVEVELLDRTRIVRGQDHAIQEPVVDDRRPRPGERLPPLNDLDVERDFDENHRLKECRLAALQLTAYLQPEEQDAFFREFFACQNSAQVLTRIEQRVGDEMLRERWRREGLLPEVEELLPALARNRFAELAKVLTGEQRAIVEVGAAISQIVVAGPGTGKTRILVDRCAWLLLEGERRPEELLVLAYNRAVMLEVRQRLNAAFLQLGMRGLAERVAVRTLHGHAAHVLGPRSRIAPVKDVCDVLGRLASTGHARWLEAWEGSAKPKWTVRRGRGWAPADWSRCDASGRKDQARDHVKPPMELWIPWAAMELADKPGLSPFRHLLLDEMQDLTGPRLFLLSSLLAPDGTTLFAVGDPDQSIYGYEREQLGDPAAAGALIDALELRAGAAGLTVQRQALSTGHRCLQEILDTARRVLPGAMPLRASDKLPKKRKDAVQCSDVEERPLLTAVRTLVDERGPVGKWPSMAVLFRTNAELEETRSAIVADHALSSQLLRMGELRLRCDLAFADFERGRQWRRIRACLAELPEECDESAVLSAVDALLGGSWRDDELLEAGRALALGVAGDLGPSLSRGPFLEALDELAAEPESLLTSLQRWERAQRGDRARRTLTLGTIHRSKGLEYDAVILAPSRSRLAASDEEERRLYYVAHTRAARRLVWLQGPREKALLADQAWCSPPLPPALFELSHLDISAVVRDSHHRLRPAVGRHQEWMSNELPMNSVVHLVKRPVQRGGRAVNRFVFVTGDNWLIGAPSQAWCDRLHLWLEARQTELSPDGFRVTGLLWIDADSVDDIRSPYAASQGGYWLPRITGVPRVPGDP